MDVAAPIGAVGPILVRGPSVMAGYLHQPERTAASVVDGWLDTGDLGFLHDGELYVCARAKDMLILRGRNYGPHEIEQAASAVPGVRAGAAAAVSHCPEDGEEERLLVFVEAPDAGPDLATRCREAVLAATGLDPGLVVVLVASTLLRTSSGKIRRGEVLRRWLDGTLVPGEKVAAWMLAGELATGALAHWRCARAEGR